MRNVTLLAVVLAGCGSSSSGGTDAPPVDATGTGGRDLPLPARGYQIRTPDIEIDAGDEITYRYITTYRGEDLTIQRWHSKMAPGSHHAILYFQNSSSVPDGTVQLGGCIETAGGVPQWMYSAQTLENDAVMPPDVGMPLRNGASVCVEMHYLNASDRAIAGGVTINAEAYPAGTSVQQAAAYITYNTQISIPPNSTGTAGGSCAIPSGANFFGLSTHVHKQGTLTRVSDNNAVLFESTDWEHPGTREWAAPFYQFTNTLDYHCEYINPTSRTVTEGQSAEFDEMCMAVGYYFPATGPKFCINSDLIN